MLHFCTWSFDNPIYFNVFRLKSCQGYPIYMYYLNTFSTRWQFGLLPVHTENLNIKWYTKKKHTSCVSAIYILGKLKWFAVLNLRGPRGKYTSYIGRNFFASWRRWTLTRSLETCSNRASLLFLFLMLGSVGWKKIYYIISYLPIKFIKVKNLFGAKGIKKKINIANLRSCNVWNCLS